MHEIFFDIETDGFNGKILYIHAFSSKYDIGFETPEKFIDFIVSTVKKDKQVVYLAHNGGGFDFVRLFPYFLKYFGEPTSLFLVHGNLIKFVYRFDKNHVLIFKDTLPLIPIALKKFAHTFGIAEKKFKIDVQHLKNVDFDEVKKYCRQDCIVLYKGYTMYKQLLKQVFHEDVDLNKVLTLPSLSFQYFKKQSRYKVPSVYSKFLKSAYAGGRTEIVKMWNNGEFYVYDVNSMYPFVMSKFDYPVSKIEPVEPDISKEGVSLVKVYSQKYQFIPYSFFKDTKLKKLYFPIFDTPLYILRTNLELRNMKKLGYDFEVVKSYISEEKGKLFEFIEEMYNLRKQYKQEGKIGLSQVLKLIMNSIYGKFGQNREREYVEFADSFSEKTKYYFTIDDKPYLINTGVRYNHALFSNLVIASYITAYARTHLFNVFRQAGEKNILYYDTDSCFTTKKLRSGKNLGELKLEAVGERFVSVQPKVYIYILPDKQMVMKAKGFPKKVFSKIKVKHPDIVFAYLERIGVKINEPTKFKKMMYNLTKNKTAFVEEEIIKYLQSNYDKRKVKRSGITYPIGISEIRGRKIQKEFNLNKEIYNKILSNC